MNNNLDWLVEEWKAQDNNINRFDYGIKLLSKYAKQRKNRTISKGEYNIYRNYIEKEFLNL